MISISHIDHIAIAVPSINAVRDFYEQALGLTISHIEEMPERGIRTAFIKLGSSMIELIEPLHEHSEISKFLTDRGPGLHHIALNTNNISDLETKLKHYNTKLVYHQARPGAHNTFVNFIHPKSTGGVLVEVVQSI